MTISIRGRVVSRGPEEPDEQSDVSGAGLTETALQRSIRSAPGSGSPSRLPTRGSSTSPTGISSRFPDMIICTQTRIISCRRPDRFPRSRAIRTWTPSGPSVTNSGLQQVLFDVFSLDVSAYYRDIRNYLGMEIIQTYDGREYARFINRDYANVRGVVLSVEKRVCKLLQRQGRLHLPDRRRQFLGPADGVQQQSDQPPDRDAEDRGPARLGSAPHTEPDRDGREAG